jgi:hypothetical protein
MGGASQVAEEIRNQVDMTGLSEKKGGSVFF